MQRRASVVGLGLIGGSLCLALRRLGWHVAGSDSDVTHAAVALNQEIIDIEVDLVDPDAEIVFVATPPATLNAVILEVLAASSCPVTDTGSVKSHLLPLCANPRFVPGHPMSGSERSRFEGITSSLFESATWVLTPTNNTDEGALAAVAALIRDFKADLRLMDARDHDRLVAAVSHVPQLAATALVNATLGRAADDEIVLARLAAGGFRDMTRIASSSPGMWIDIFTHNRFAITAAMDAYLEQLRELRDLVAHGEPGVASYALESAFERATQSHASLPVRPSPHTELIVELRSGEGTVMVLGLATTLDISISDYYVEAARVPNLLHLSVPSDQAEYLRGGLTARGLKVEQPKRYRN